MRTSRIIPSIFAILATAGTASAQITIANVFNAASRVVNGSIAQGALIAVVGKGVGTQDVEQAAFPLPTTAGLGGITIQIGAGGQSYDAIIVYTKPNEVGAILPSAVPVGRATVTVNNNGVTASKDINVIDAAFGIFTQKYGTANGLALAFNANSDGSLTPNTTTQSVIPGQDVIINGTGLGAISSDETQSGATDIPAANVHVYVGIQAATVVSAGRGACCDGVDPAYQVPQGIAAWDVIASPCPTASPAVTCPLSCRSARRSAISLRSQSTPAGLPARLFRRASRRTWRISLPIKPVCRTVRSG